MPNVLITILDVLAGMCLPCGAICVYTSGEDDDAGVAMLVFSISWVIFIIITEIHGGAYGL